MKSRQYGPSGAAAFIGDLFASPRLTLALLAVLIGISFVGTWIPQEGASTTPLERLYSPETLYLFKIAGLTDIFHSGWFISVLGLIALNLIAFTFRRFPSAWRTVTLKAPPAVNVNQIVQSKKHDRYLYLDLRTPIAREEFRDRAKEIARKKIGKLHVLRDEGGLNELQLCAQEGRFGRLGIYGAYAALIVLACSGLYGYFRGFEGQVSVEEGAKVGFLQITRGAPNWPLLRERGRSLPGFYTPGFEIECVDFNAENYPESSKLKAVQSTLNFYENGELKSSQTVRANRPAVFRGIRFYQSSFGQTGRVGATLELKDRANGDATTQVRSADQGSTHALENASFKILDIEEREEGMGPAVQLEYSEKGGAPERFWVFKNFPGYDAAHRKKSRYTFALETLKPRRTTLLTVSKDPGRVVAVWASAALVAFLIVSFWLAHNRYWMIWVPGRATLIATSDHPLLFAPRFEAVANKFKALMGGVDKSDKAALKEAKRPKKIRAATRALRAAEAPPVAPGSAQAEQVTE